MDISNNLQTMLFTTMNMSLINRINSNGGNWLNTFFNLTLLLFITIGCKYMETKNYNIPFFILTSFFMVKKMRLSSLEELLLYQIRLIEK